MNFRHARFSMLVSATSVLLGCATPVTYGPIGGERQFGYSDMHNADGSYTIRVIAPSAEMAHQFWDQRAAELCGSADYQKNIFRAEIPVTTQYGYAPSAYGGAYPGGSYTQDVRGAPILEGYLNCGSETP